MTMAHRTYVRVVVEYDEAGGVHPLMIRWEDGRKFRIDRLVDVRRAVAAKAGGVGTRYTCRILGRETYLFEDDGRWFVEEKDAQDGMKRRDHT